MRAPLLLCFCLLVLHGTAVCDEPPASPPRPRTPKAAADAAMAAAKADDKQALAELAARDQPDPWVVADELCYRGQHDVAMAFSKAAPRAAVEKLSAYVEAWRAREPDTGHREILDATYAALRAGKPQKVIDLTAAVEGKPDTVLRLRLAHGNGIAHRMLRKLAEGEAALRATADAATALGWLTRAATLYDWAGLTARQMAAYAKALDNYNRALALRRAIEDKSGAAATLGNMGIVHQELGDFAKALETHQAALAQKREIGDRAGTVATLINIASVHGLTGDYPKALALFEQALEEQGLLGDRAGAAASLGGIATVQQHLGDYAKALATYAQALEEYRALDDNAGVADTLGNMGIVHQALGDYANALATYEQAYSKKRVLGDRASAAATLGNMGHVYRSLGDYPKALATYDRALAEKTAIRNEAGAAKTLANIGIIHQELGDYPKALATYQEALERIIAVGDKAGAATALGYVGSVQGDLGEFDKAIQTYDQVLEQMHTLGDRVGAASTLAGIGRVHHQKGDRTEARKFYEMSARAAKSLRATRLHVLALQELARLALEEDQPARALSAAQKALRETEHLLGGLGGEQGAMARSQHADLFAIGALAAVREGDAAEVLTFLESGRAGALLDALDKREALRWRAGSLPPELQRLNFEAGAAEKAARNAYDLATQRRNLPEMRAAAKALVEVSEAVQQIADRIERVLQHELQQQTGLFYPRAKTIEEIEASLLPDQALVLYGLCVDKAIALVLREGGERIVALGDASALTDACAAFDASDSDTTPQDALVTLRKLLVEPLALGKDVQQVLISPEGPLCYLPFGALFEQTVTMTPSGTTHLLLLREERAKGKGILAIGDPDYDGASEGAQEIYYRGRVLRPLKSSRKEVERIGTTKLLGSEASEAGFAKALHLSKRWRAVHFACHGLVNVERPMLSSLALSRTGADDGFLTALQILRTKIPADLAVLSACETGTGKIVRGEGIVGMTRAFMFAGSPRVICSLWKVHDEATQVLMVKFYELWNPASGEGLSAAAALQQAQAFIRSQEKWKHPYYWAAWVLWGLPD